MSQETKTVTIPEERYKELLEIEEDYKTILAIRSNSGSRYRNILDLVHMDQHFSPASQNPGWRTYQDLKQNFKEKGGKINA